jgi:glucose/arabinose dehydrogenase
LQIERGHATVDAGSQRRYASHDSLSKGKNVRRKIFYVIFLLGLWCTACAKDLPLERIQLPPGFRIELLARVPDARGMAWGDNGILFVGTMNAGKVYALELDKRYRAGKLHVVGEGLKLPIGVAYFRGNLYVSSVDRILRFDGIARRLATPPRPIVIRRDLPAETHHGGRYLGFSSDGWLYVSVGAACNICEPDPDRYAGIWRMKPNGSQFENFAHGIRNSVGFDWHPDTGELWFTDNGRDLMGDDVPPDELDHAPKAGMHFGFPYCHGDAIPDPEYGGKRSCSAFAPPARNLGPHVAALGMRFYTGKQFPAEYRNRIFIAEHGSWNRSTKAGYRISMVTLEGNKAVAYQPFATGWLQGQTAWGRPADVLVLPDGSLLVSDDKAGAIYRVTYGVR